MIPGGGTRAQPICLVLLGLVSACQSDRASSNLAGLRGLRIEQSVRLTPDSPTSNRVVTIASAIISHEASPLDVTSRTCGLDVAGDLDLGGSLLMCAAFSRRTTLTPSESLTAFDARVVTSPPGRYTLRVRQLLDPEHWTEVPVVVK